VRFDLNMDGAVAVLTLTFSETVDAATLDITKISLQTSSSATNAAFTHRLVAGTYTSQQRHPSITVELSEADLDVLKLKRIALSAQSTWLVMDLGAVRNVFDLDVLPVQDGINALMVDGYIADSTKPVLDSFTFNMNDGTFPSSVDGFISLFCLCLCLMAIPAMFTYCFPIVHLARRNACIAGSMALTFSEPVSSQTLQAIKLKLQNKQSKP
jgi:hypothetical protein